jgi:protein-tyrosine phosphatase
MRTANKAETVDIIQHNAIDRTVTEVAYRKTFAPNMVSLDPDGPNKGKTHDPDVKEKLTPAYKHPVYSVALPKIYRFLVLANYDYVNRQPTYENFNYIVNLSHHKMRRNTRLEDGQVHNLHMSDDAKQPYHFFKQRMIEVANLIEEAEAGGKNIVVNCLAGCNRSVAAIVAYAVVKKGWKIHHATEYIEQEKVKTYGGRCWDTLTNGKFRQQLRQMEIDHQQKLRSLAK